MLILIYISFPRLWCTLWPKTQVTSKRLRISWILGSTTYRKLRVDLCGTASGDLLDTPVSQWVSGSVSQWVSDWVRGSVSQCDSPMSIIIVYLLWIMSSPPANAALIGMMAAEEDINKSAYQDFAEQQINYMLGSCGGQSFQIGFGDKFPLRPHHRAA